jgi:hypothetical protein
VLETIPTSEPATPNPRKGSLFHRFAAIVLGIFLGLGLILLIVKDQTIQAVDSRLAEAAKLLDLGEADTARAELLQVDDELTAAENGPWLPYVSWHCATSRQNYRLQEKRFEESQEKDRLAREEFTEGLRSLLGQIKEKLERNDLAGAYQLLDGPVVGIPADDPIRDSLRRFLRRWGKETRAWRPEDATAFARMVDEGTAWRAVRRDHTATSYRHFLALVPQGPFADEARALLVDVEVTGILAQTPDELPPVQETRKVRGRWYTVVYIANQASFPAKVRFSGPDSFQVDFAPGEKVAVRLLNGPYQVTASVESSPIRHFARKAKMTGDDLLFVVLFGAPAPDLDLKQPFARWPLQRDIPAYLQ